MPRPPATGKIEKAGKHYTTRLTLTWPDGKVRQHQITRPTKEMVRAAREALLRERDQAALKSPRQRALEKTTIGELIKLYKAERAQPAQFLHGVKVAGMKGYEERQRLLNIVADHFAEQTPVNHIGTAEIEQYKQTRIPVKTAKGNLRKVATINHEIEILRALLYFAVSRGIIATNPFELLSGIIQSSHEDKRTRVPTFGEELAMLSQCYTKKNIRRDYFRSVLVIIADTGMRRGELTALRRDWLDFTARAIHLPREATKNNRARIIPMTDRVLLELQNLIATKGKDSELVLGGITDFETIFRNVRTDAKVDDLRFHDFRHAFVTRSIIVGVPLAAITAASGHISDEWQRYANPSYDGVKSLLLPHKDQTEAEVKEYAKTVLHGLKHALGYDLDALLS
jgi:integrase